ncbi:MAG: M48 family metallopeptidase [Proteobacteria bacterium]|nr:M48 family metallopeptidase [Pseudomonadota bacterium]
MPILDASVPRHLLWPLKARWPQRRARSVIRRFAACFPEIEYDIENRVRLANAQAFLEAGKKRVRLFGGLVRHRKVGSAGLAVVLAHETGHHLGGPPFFVPYRWLSSEDQATRWAESVGLVLAFGPERAPRIWSAGRAQLAGLAGEAAG